MDLIPNQRHLFNMPDHITYYNCAYLSPQMLHVQQAGELGSARKTRPWEVFPEHFFEESNRLRELAAGLIGARSTDMALLPAASYGLSVAANNVPVRPNSNILVLAEQFPSNYYPWLEKTKDNCHLLVIDRPSDGDWTTVILNALEKNVSVAALPHCHWTDGSLIDLVAVGQRCQDLQIPLVLDVTQSLGALPLDVREIRPAFMISATYKWLFGPYSVGLMYVDPRYHNGNPLEHNWISREGSENFSGLVDYTDAIRPDASRFDVGERSNFALLPMVIAALEQINEWGIARISKTLGAYNKELVRGANALGFHCAEEDKRAPHLLGLRYQGKLPTELADKLRSHQIFVSIRGDAIRVSPHLYNTVEERDRFLEVLASLV